MGNMSVPAQNIFHGINKTGMLIGNIRYWKKEFRDGSSIRNPKFDGVPFFFAYWGLNKKRWRRLLVGRAKNDILGIVSANQGVNSAPIIDCFRTNVPVSRYS